MAKVLVTESNLEDIGDAIRDRLQVNTTYLPSEMGDAVRSIRVIDIDTTLTRSGYAADAKVVGDRFDDLIDPVLHLSGKAADAKATGNAIADVQKAVDDTSAAVGVELIEGFVGGQYIATNVGVGETVAISSPQTSPNFAYKVVNVFVGDKITLNGTGGNGGRLWAFIDSSNALLSKADANAVASNFILTAPANAAKLVLNVNVNAAIGANYVGTSVDSRIAGNVDATLSISGKAADAFSVGSKFSDIDTPIQVINASIYPQRAVLGNTITSLRVNCTFSRKPSLVLFDGDAVPAAPQIRMMFNPDVSLTDTSDLTLTARDSDGNTAEIVLPFTFRNWLGAAALDEPQDIAGSFVQSIIDDGGALIDQSFQGTRVNVNASGSKYAWIALPARFGQLAISVNGVIGGFALVGIVSFTNSTGYTENYKVYKSNYAGLGNISIELEVI